MREDFQVAVSVIDEGRGIPGERLPHIFRKFSQTESEDHGGGTGLGLAICKGIVEAHGGRLWAESDGAGLGARFTFTVPVAEDAAAERHSPPAHFQEEVRGESILVVDDDPQTLRHVRRVLSEAGYTPIVTADPREALRIMQEALPNLALLDMVLPGFDGIDLMRGIFSIAQVPVVFLSAYGHDHVVAEALEAGATDYIVKPFSQTELVARIKAALRRQMAPQLVEPSEPYVLEDLTIDYAERLVSVAGRSVHLTPKEYDLLHALSVNAGQVLTHWLLLRQLWGHENHVARGTVRTIVRRLRRKLGDDASSPRYIFSEPRVGYRMPKGELRGGGGGRRVNTEPRYR